MEKKKKERLSFEIKKEYDEEEKLQDDHCLLHESHAHIFSLVLLLDDAEPWPGDRLALLEAAVMPK